MNAQADRSNSVRRRSSSGTKRGTEHVVAGRFPRAAKLLRHGDFDRVYREGRRQFMPHMTVFYLSVPDGSRGPRIGLTVGRALGGAVDRNRIKRRLREAVRAQLSRFTAAVDVVMNPKKTVLSMEFKALADEVARALSQVQSLMEKQQPRGGE